jgi:hypothetical protein
MPAAATIQAEIADLKAKLATATDLDLIQAIQDRVDSIVQQGLMSAPVFGSPAAVTKSNKGKK